MPFIFFFMTSLSNFPTLEDREGRVIFHPRCLLLIECYKSSCSIIHIGKSAGNEPEDCSWNWSAQPHVTPCANSRIFNSDWIACFRVQITGPQWIIEQLITVWQHLLKLRNHRNAAQSGLRLYRSSLLHLLPKRLSLLTKRSFLYSLAILRVLQDR